MKKNETPLVTYTNEGIATKIYCLKKIDEIIEGIKNPEPEIKEKILKIRELKTKSSITTCPYSKRILSDEAANLKKSLPNFCMATFEGNQRNGDNLIEAVGLILDIDKIVNVDELKDKLKNDPSVHCSFIL